MLKIYYWTLCMGFGSNLAGGGDLTSLIEMFININFLFFFLILGRGIWRFIYFKYIMDQDLYDKLSCGEEFYRDLRAWEQNQ